MHISVANIENYKSFASSDAVLQSGFNIVVGANNAGKTAFLEALSLNFQDNPHRSLSTMPTRDTTVRPYSVVQLSFVLSNAEIKSILTSNPETFYLPIPESITDYPIWTSKFPREQGFIVGAFDDVIGEVNKIDCVYTEGQFISAKLEGTLVDQHNRARVIQVLVDAKTREFRADPQWTWIDNLGTVAHKIALALRSRVYMFRAERMHIGRWPIGYSSELQTNTANLPEVLNALQTGNPYRFQRFNELVRIVFPELRQITVPTIQEPNHSQLMLEVKLWSIEASTQRDDLAMPLLQSGTGISQVLAILYVVLTSEHPRVIIIDEPQSFLHPGAVRKLLQILSHDFPHHQYIITTHSPLILTVTNPKAMLLVSKQESESTIQNLDVQKAEHVQNVLSEVGARPADYFGADDILWVEGPTEVNSYRLLITNLLRRPLLSTQILPILSTSELEGKHAERVIEIYNNLSSGPNLLPPALGFVLDREGRSEDKRKQIETMSKGRAYFLPRRMYENYLLEPEALAYLINRDDAGENGTGRESQLTTTELEQWLDAHRWNAGYFDKNIADADRTSEFWLREVHAAKLLNDLFNHFTEARLSYTDYKVEYGYSLTEWLLNNAPDQLTELADFLAFVLDTGAEPNTEPRTTI